MVLYKGLNYFVLRFGESELDSFYTALSLLMLLFFLYNQTKAWRNYDRVKKSGWEGNGSWNSTWRNRGCIEE